MNQFHSTTITELELADELQVDAILILYFAAHDLIDCDRDELGLIFTPTQIANFREGSPAILAQAQERCERIARTKTARANASA